MFAAATSLFGARSNISQAYTVVAPGQQLPPPANGLPAPPPAPAFHVGLWRVANAAHKTTGKRVSVWTFEKRSQEIDRLTPPARERVLEVLKAEVNSLLPLPATAMLDAPFKGISSRTLAAPVYIRYSFSPPTCQSHLTRACRDGYAAASARPAFKSLKSRSRAARRDQIRARLRNRDAALHPPARDPHGRSTSIVRGRARRDRGAHTRPHSLLSSSRLPPRSSRASCKYARASPSSTPPPASYTATLPPATLSSTLQSVPSPLHRMHTRLTCSRATGRSLASG